MLHTMIICCAYVLKAELSIPPDVGVLAFSACEIRCLSMVRVS